MSTKTKLTVTIDAEVLPRARDYARSHGVSLSSVVERALREVTADEPSPEEAGAAFVARWRGVLQPSDLDGDPRHEYLARKYLA